MQHHCWVFGDFALDRDRGTLMRGEVELTLRPKSFAVLTYLVEHPGRLISRDELFAAVWGQSVVTDGTLTQCLVDIRRAMQDRSQTIVRTVHGRGVRFELPVSERICEVILSVHAGPQVASMVSMPGVLPPAAPEPGGPDGLKTVRWRMPARRSTAAAALLVLASSSSMHGVHPTRDAAASQAVAKAALASANSEVSVPRAPLQMPGVREHLLQARYLYNRRDPGDLDQAVAWYREALQIDARSAEAWAGLSHAHLVRGADPHAPVAGALDEALRAAQMAVALNPQSADAQVGLARALAWQGDAQGAAAARLRARQLDPEHPMLLGREVGRAVRDGRLEEAIDLLRRNIVRDPTSLPAHQSLVSVLAALGRFAETETVAQRTRLLSSSADAPSARTADGVLVEVLILQGRFDEAEGIIAGWAPGVRTSRSLALIGASRGDLAAVETTVAELHALDSWEAAYWLAKIHTLAGRPDVARRWVKTALSRAEASRQPSSIRFAQVEIELSAILRFGSGRRR